MGSRFSVFSFLGKGGKKWKWTARVSPVEKAEDGGRKAKAPMQKMADTRQSLDDVEDMETEMSPECKPFPPPASQPPREGLVFPSPEGGCHVVLVNLKLLPSEFCNSWGAPCVDGALLA